MASEREWSGSSKRARELGPKYVFVEHKDTDLAPEQAETYYLMTRIASLLFPDTIPRVGAATFDKTTGKAGYITEKIVHDPLHQRHQKMKRNIEMGPDFLAELKTINEEFLTLEQRPDYVEFVERAEAVGLTGYEYRPHNFSYGSDGKLKFFDFEPAWHQWKKGEVMSYKLNFDPPKLTAAILMLPNAKKQEAIEAYNRIRELAPSELKDKLPTI